MLCKNLPQIIFSKVVRAVVEFDLIDDGDKILIGVSGGKDSLLLTYALAILKQRAKKNFDLTALTINPKFTEDFGEKISRVKNFCNELGIEHTAHEVDIAGLIRDQKNKSPCYTCAYFRRAVVNRVASEIGANKIAYAHHLDDAVETFFMSLLSSGQLTTFKPKTFLDRTSLTVIRPLVYVRESEIKNFVAKSGFDVLKSPCPFDGATNRQQIKNLIGDLEKNFPDLFNHLAAAMRKDSIGELWDAPKTREQMRKNYFALKFGGTFNV
ncbi:MAG: tRNA lysidine(34) synthetase TilS [Selenomonadaceae bacterium]|nr:tRNA lysidine(34) synthetase TilS [Selenomonadaceae bacterium]